MNGQVDLLGGFWAAIQSLLGVFADFLLSFLPDGDPEVYAIIDGVGQVGNSSTFNVFYFCDWAAVLVCFGVLVTVILIMTVLKYVLKSMDMAHKVVESVPVIE